ncbi:DUF1684 domain-containing protein [Algoriphagus sp. H41]|uniref:DUF1684 domain-containing protein n=1 Tax=Algoriphagus oliviformis TaxID=2811231 RepID=A0ABS3C5B9_9BACT|nr:DUF1684 domain-containing protein [Algoriphagus oliviformis]MBN7812040.1 DUF1684 domain-containing protein [Algoriphagus oliviformis]
MKTPIAFLLAYLSIAFSAFSQNAEFEQWKDHRCEELLAENGWLNLAGLLWLEPGANHLYWVNDDSLAISSSAQKRALGLFRVASDRVVFSSATGQEVANSVGKANEMVQFPLEEGQDGSLQSGKWKWSVIERGGRFAVRLRNLQHPALAAYAPTPTFGYDPHWRLDAFFQPKFNEFMSITNVLGQVIEWRVMGLLKFEIDGEKQELIMLEDEGKLFVIFSDETNDRETYPSGRYLYVAFPDNKGNTIIDFNYAYNPPCAYTAFATCPIPPRENRLDFRIEAGEKVPLSH